MLITSIQYNDMDKIRNSMSNVIHLIVTLDCGYYFVCFKELNTFEMQYYAIVEIILHSTTHRE